MNPLEQIAAQAAREKKKIVLPEGADARVAEAAMRVAARGLAEVVLIAGGGNVGGGNVDGGNVDGFNVGGFNVNEMNGMRVVDPQNNPRAREHVDALLRARADKGMTRAQALREINAPLTLAMCMVACGDADGCVAGAVNTTADVLRAALQIVGAKSAEADEFKTSGNTFGNAGGGGDTSGNTFGNVGGGGETSGNTFGNIGGGGETSGNTFGNIGGGGETSGDTFGNTGGGGETSGDTFGNIGGVGKTSAMQSQTKPEPGLVSSFFLMLHELPHQALQGAVVFADCAMVVEPDAEQLARIAIDTADSAAALLRIVPRVALLSFSTAGSARHAHVDKVRAAGEIVAARRGDIALLPEVQFDAAVIPEILKRKAPNIKTPAPANIFIFPDLQSANIGYKIAERIGGAVAVGPIIQGLARPVNDLSRGCSVDDIVALVAVTARQAQTTLEKV